MPDVFPRRNLPNEAEPWGRAHDDRVMSLETQMEGLTQSLQGQNRNSASSLAVIAAQVQKIADQQQILIDQQATLAAQQAQLTSQQTSLTNTVNFLASQTVADSKGTLSQFSGTTNSLTWEGFDGTYDCSVVVTTGSAGKLLIQGSATLLSSNTTSILGIEVVGIVGPSYPGPYSTYVSTLSAASSGVTRAVVFSGAANTPYNVRLRRGRDGSGSGAAMWRDQTLVVTRS